ncbi:hypothetical protein SAMN05421505_102174 [Sinosporangium album]|uniref:DUF4870 domain-containing protein n=1 Tax=Sinosporangium album TaxID=504805 RepID=A0A1G7S5H1_9ACTN|nr:DUF4870 domain-containing protein [Sinosporangium album]SDG18231.1 hypothetical protein SAMN05421505_102174 [Sinosporangium album]
MSHYPREAGSPPPLGDYPRAAHPPPPKAGRYSGYGPAYGYGTPGYGMPVERYAPGRYGPRPRSDDSTMAVLAHLSGLANLILWPFGFVGALIIYVTKREHAPYARDQAAESLNFWITMSVLIVASMFFAVTMLLMALSWTPFLLPVVLWIYALVVGIVGAVSASKGQNFRYPLTLRLVR